MHKKYNNNILDEEEFLTTSYKKNNRNHKKTAQQVTNQKKQQRRTVFQTEENQDENLINQFTYKASRYEGPWLIKSLSEFYENNWITDVTRMIKGGKEASVYLCETLNHRWLAAKVYRPRKFRNLRNDGLYREGRDNLDEDGNIITNAGMLYAMRKKSTYGKHLLHQSWIKHEFNTMRLLYKAGCDIPNPLTSGANSMLMEYIGDEQISAPVLQAITLTHAEAKEIGQRIVNNIELMLANQRIHGDLSPFNVLIWHGEIKLIDFPQAIHPNQNPQAFQIFKRDLQKMDEYLQLFGYQMMEEHTPEKMWKKYQYMQAEDYLYDLPDQFDEPES